MTAQLRLIVITCFFALSVSGQVAVGLRLDTTTPTGVEHSLFCDPNRKCGLLPDEASKQDMLPHTTIPIRIWRDGKDFLFSVGIDGRSLKGDEGKVRLRNGGSAIITIRKEVVPGRFVLLPYELTHLSDEYKGTPVDDFSIGAHYILRGTFKYRGCETEIGLKDIRAEGKFDLSNADAGTNLEIDRNKDGKFWGRGEFAKTSEIVELCGRNFIASGLSYSKIVFTPTALRLARVGERSEDFSISLLDGTSVSRDSQVGRPYLLDFWASWCRPCVGSLPHIKELRDATAGRLDVFSINVDKPSARGSALTIVEKNGLRSFTSIRGLGDNDPVWQTFGGANQNSLTIPLYVVVDKDAVIRYLGNGGKDLADLKAAIEKVGRP